MSKTTETKGTKDSWSSQKECRWRWYNSIKEEMPGCFIVSFNWWGLKARPHISLHSDLASGIKYKSVNYLLLEIGDGDRMMLIMLLLPGDESTATFRDEDDILPREITTKTGTYITPSLVRHCTYSLSILYCLSSSRSLFATSVLNFKVMCSDAFWRPFVVDFDLDLPMSYTI